MPKPPAKIIPLRFFCSNVYGFFSPNFGSCGLYILPPACANIVNKKINHKVNGNTNTVYINPLNSLKFVLNKIRKEKVSLDKDFYVFTGSTVGVVPIKSKGEYIGKVDKLGTVRTTIN